MACASAEREGRQHGEDGERAGRGHAGEDRRARRGRQAGLSKPAYVIFCRQNVTKRLMRRAAYVILWIVDMT